jgi:hypothetical protein
MRLFCKGQVKLFESIAVLLVFFILIGIGIKFYGGVQLQALEDAKQQFLTLDAIKVSNMLTTLPELSCTLQNVRQGTCIDYLKIQAWSNKSVYWNFIDELGSARVTVHQVYPFASEWVVYDISRGDEKDSTVTYMPLTIYNPVSDTDNFGYMKVELLA